MDKPKITYGRTAYAETTQGMLDSIESNLDNWAEGEGNCCIIAERMDEFLAEAKENADNTDDYPPELVEFIQAVVDGIEGDVGDIVFNS